MAEVPMRRLMWATVAGVAILAVAAIVWSAVKGARGTVPPPPRHTELVPGTAGGGPTAAAEKGIPIGLAGVTAAHGPSWVAHLHLDVKTTPLGRQGGAGSPPPGIAAREDLGGRFQVRGADLYRLDCQSCHGPKGEGKPPEINALLGPVSATMPKLMAARLAKTGQHLPAKMLAQMAAQARAIIVLRLRDGGRHMPAFAHLDKAEVAALIDHLQRLVAPVARMPVTLFEPPARVGEHLVKGTCQICHGAVGAGGHRVALSGGVPSLQSLATDYPVSEVVAKVREGTPAGGAMIGGRGMMGGRGMGRGRMGQRMMAPAGGWKMPVLPYLSPQEITAAMRYLKTYPPKP